MRKIFLLIFFLFSVSTNLQAVTFDYCMTNNLDNYVCGLIGPPCVDVFNAETDYSMALYYFLKDVKAGETAQVKWYFENEFYGQGDLIAFPENSSYCGSSELIIMGTEIEHMTGNWKVEFYYNNQFAFEDTCFLQGIQKTCIASYVLDEPDLETLRQFRDSVLMRSEKGKKLVEIYYKTSPELIQLVENNPAMKAALRKIFQSSVYIVKQLMN